MSGRERVVRELAEGLAGASRLGLIEAAGKGQGSRRVVRRTLDRKGGVDLAACQDLSRAISARLDEADPVPGRYTLEVSSPGVTHPLEGRRAFERVEGRLVRVLRQDAPELTGAVRAADDEAVVLDVDGEDVRVPYVQIVKATQALPW